MSLVVLQQSDAVLEVGAMIRTLWTKAADDGSLLKRLVRGQKMARTKGQVKRLSCKRFRVKSQSKKTDYGFLSQTRVMGQNFRSYTQKPIQMAV